MARKLKFKPRAALQSCKGELYQGELVVCTIKIPRNDWQALLDRAAEDSTTASEIVRVLIRDFLAGVETPSPRASMVAGR